MGPVPKRWVTVEGKTEAGVGYADKRPHDSWDRLSDSLRLIDRKYLDGFLTKYERDSQMLEALLTNDDFEGVFMLLDHHIDSI